MIAHIDVVVEAILDRWPDAEFCPRKQCFYGFCHQMRGTVPVGSLCLVVLPLVQLDRSIDLDRAEQVDDFAVHRDCEDSLCQSCTDALGNLMTRHSFVKRTGRTVRKRNLNFRHDSICLCRLHAMTAMKAMKARKYK